MSKTPICVDVIAETHAAVLVTDSVVEEWVPRSQIEDGEDITTGDGQELEIADWILEEKGFC